MQAIGDRLQLLKVNSHQDATTARDEAEQWIFRGNETADSLTQRVVQTYPLIFFDMATTPAGRGSHSHPMKQSACDVGSSSQGSNPKQ